MKISLTDSEVSDIAFALREKAESDEKRAEELKNEPRHARLAATFADQARRQRELADKVEQYVEV